MHPANPRKGANNTKAKVLSGYYQNVYRIRATLKHVNVDSYCINMYLEHNID